MKQNAPMSERIVTVMIGGVITMDMERITIPGEDELTKRVSN